MGSSSTSWSKSGWDRRELSARPALPRAFYERDTVQVARELLGKVLLVRALASWGASARGGRSASYLAGRIVETEAYHGTDPASHSGRGLTPRSAVMFGEPGVAYVYFIYGSYEMLNFVTEREGYPGAVLIRALEPLAEAHGEAGERLLGRRRRGLARAQWTNGPGRLCRAMGIRLAHNRKPLTGPELRVVDDGARVRDADVLASPRVGISRAQDRLWRFFVAGNPFVSPARENRQAVELGRAAIDARAERAAPREAGR